MIERSKYAILFYTVLIALTTVGPDKHHNVNELECFYNNLRKELEDAADSDTSQTEYTLLYLRKRNTEIQKFLDLCAPLMNQQRYDDNLTLMTIKKRYNDGISVKPDNLLFDIIVAALNHFKHKDCSFTHTQNLEINIYTMKYENYYDLDAANKHIKNIEKIAEKTHQVCNRATIEDTFLSLRPTMINFLMKKLLKHTYDSARKNYTSNQSIDLCKHLIKELIDFISGPELRYKLWKCVKDLPRGRERCIKLCKKIYAFQDQLNFQYYDAKDKYHAPLAGYIGIILSRKWEAFLDICIGYIQKKIPKLLIENGNAKFEIYCIEVVNGLSKLIQEKSIDCKLISYEKFEQMMTGSDYFDSFATSFESYFDTLGYKHYIGSLTLAACIEVDEDMNRRFYCKDNTMISFNSKLDIEYLRFLCKTINQTGVLEEPSKHCSVFISKDAVIDQSALLNFDKKYTGHSLALHNNKQYLRSDSEILQVFRNAKLESGETFLTKYTMGKYQNDSESKLVDQNITEKNSQVKGKSIKCSIRTVDNVLNIDLSEIPEEKRKIWIGCIKSSCTRFPMEMVTISLDDKFIFIFSSTQESGHIAKKSIIYNAKDLHLISTHDQFFECKELDSNIYYIRNIPESFLLNLHSHLQIQQLTGKPVNMREKYLTPENCFFRKDYISYDEFTINCKGIAEHLNKGKGYIIHECIKEFLCAKFLSFWNSIKTVDYKTEDFLTYRLWYKEYKQNNKIKIVRQSTAKVAGLREDLHNKLVANDRYSDLILHHHNHSSWYTILHPILVCSVTRMGKTSCLFIVKSEFEQNIDFSIANIPLMTLAKTLIYADSVLKNPSKCVRSETNGLRLETLIINEIQKSGFVHKINTGIHSQECVEYVTDRLCKEYMNSKKCKLRGVDYACIENDKESSANLQRILNYQSLVDDHRATIKDKISEIIHAMIRRRSISVTTIFLKKPTARDIEKFGKIKDEITESLEKIMDLESTYE